MRVMGPLAMTEPNINRGGLELKGSWGGMTLYVPRGFAKGQHVLAEGLQRLSQLVAEFPQIIELDINP